MPRSSWIRPLRKPSTRDGSTAAVSRKRSSRISRPRYELLEDRAVPAVLSAFLTTEHVDLNIVFPGGSANGWSLQPRDADNAVSHDPGDALLYVGDNAQSLVARPGDSAFNFVGVAAGEDFYRLPQSQDPELLYLGFAGYGANAGTFDRYNPSAESKGRVSGVGRWLKVSLVNVEHTTPSGEAGDGAFSVWQSGDTAPNVFMSSYDDGVRNPNANGLDTTDGIGADDALWIVAGGHIHYNFGFTEKGRYEVTFRTSGYVGDDGQSTPNAAGFSESDPITLYFSVGSVGELEFDAASYTVDEDAGTATIGVRRVGGSDGRISARYATSDATATAGSDYTASSGTLVFNDGETYKTINVPILDDSLVEPDETLTLTLSQAGPARINNYYIDYEGDANGLLGSRTTATLTILDDDTPPPNTPPSISDVADLATDEDTPTAAIPFAVGDAETTPGDLVVTATSSNTALVPNGGIVLGGSGANRTVTITPAADQFGTTTITLTVTDADGLQSTDSFVLTVNPVNDAPTITPIGDVVMNEDGDLTINFTISDVETAAASLSMTGTRTNTTLFPSIGTGSTARLRLGGTGTDRTLRIRPAANLSGTSSVTLTVTDANGAIASQTFQITVNAVNDPPRATDDSVFAHVGTATPLTGLLSNDGDIDSASFSLVSFTQPTSGAVTQGTDGVLTYTPEAGFRGFDSFTYTLQDAEGATATATVSLSVGVVDLVHTDLDVNYLNGEWYSDIHADYGPDVHVDSDEAVLFANPTTRTTMPSPPAFAFIGANPGDDIWLLPQTQDLSNLWLGFSNEDTAAGVLAGDIRLDLVGFSGPGHLSLFDIGSFGTPRAWIDTADGVNSASDADVGGNSGDVYTLIRRAHSHLNWTFTQPGRYTISLRPTALVNTTDANGNPIQVATTGPVATYYFDVDTLTGIALSENPPLARHDVASAALGGGPVTINVLANDTSAPDPGEALTVTAVTQGASGGVAIGAGGTTVVYTPGAGFAGTDTFTYTITDEHGGTATATVTVTVDGRPAISEIADRFLRENTSTGPIAFTVGDAETHAGALIVTATSSNTTLVPNANLVLGGSGANRTLAITPAANQLGAITITITVTDAAGLQSSETFVLTVTANRLVPFAMPAYYGGTLDTNAWYTATADFNGDGSADLVTAAGAAPVYFQGTGDGGFLTERALTAGPGFGVEGIAAVDYDSDDDADLLAFEGNRTTGEGAIALHRNDGTGQFTRVVVKGGLQNGYGLQVGDFNEDGRPDVAYLTSQYDAATNTQTLAFHYALQQPGGELGPVTTLWTSNGYGNLLVGDVNGDGNLDIVGAETVYAPDFSSSTNTLLVFPGGGDGTFGEPQATTAGSGVSLMQIVDVNGDGRADLIVSDRVGDSRVGYYPQQVDGSLGARVGLLPGTGQLNALRVADINGDGVPDLVSDTYSADYSSLSLSWSPGLGGGAFGPAVMIAPNNSNINSIQVVDLDGDSYPDIVAGGYGSSTQPGPMRVFINKTGENPMVLLPPAGRGYVAGDPIDLRVYFGFPITVTGTPRIALQVGENAVYADYVSGSGTPTLLFRYTVGAADIDLDGVQLLTNVIDLNGGTLTDPIGGTAVLEFPNLPFNGVVVNAPGPLVQMISRLDASPTVAGTVRFAVQFAEDVTGVDLSDFAVRMTEGDLSGASVLSVTGSGSLYEVTVSTGTGSGALGLSVLGSASIADLNGDVLGKGYAGGQVYTVRQLPVGEIDAYYTDGHADYRPVYEDGEFSYVLNDGYSAVPNDEVITYLDSTAIVSRPAASAYDFLGVGAGEPYYLSDSNGSIATVPYLGWSGESLVAGAFAAYRPADPRITSNTPQGYVKVQMVGMRSSSGGDFSLYSIASGSPRVWMATSDGIGDTDNIWLYPGTHLHRNTAFSKPGTYEIDVVISGYLDSNGNGVYDPIVDPYVESGIQTMVFHVDTLGARDDAFAVNAGETLEGSVAANDEWHPGLGGWAASVVSTTANGTLTLQPDGSFTYVPATGFVGTDSFVYRLTNEREGFTTATVTITVVDTTPLTVQQVVVNDGAAQRSNVESLTVRFSRETNLQELIDGGTIVDAVQVFSGGARVTLPSSRFRYDAATHSLTVDLTVDGFGGSRSTLLADGDYELRLDAAMITTTGQAPSNLQDTDGTVDGSFRSGFHRLQGDFDGDRAVDAADVDLFLAHYGGIAGLMANGKYDYAFDLTGPGDAPDGAINLADYVLMRRRVGRRL